MSSSDSAIVAKTANVDQGSYFIRLPTEVREMIYRPLLIARYTMKEHNMNSKKVGFAVSYCLNHTDVAIS